MNSSKEDKKEEKERVLKALWGFISNNEDAVKNLNPILKFIISRLLNFLSYIPIAGDIFYHIFINMEVINKDSKRVKLDIKKVKNNDLNQIIAKLLNQISYQSRIHDFQKFCGVNIEKKLETQIQPKNVKHQIGKYKNKVNDIQHSRMI